MDTCVIIDVLEGDPEFGRDSARLLDKMAGEGLTVCPISYIELAPAFLGDGRRQNEFLSKIGVQYTVPWDWKDTQRAHKAWERYVNRRRDRQISKRPIADILIGSFAAGRKGLLTRNPDDFNLIFPSLKILPP